MSTSVYGASDDLIEVEGDVTEEFPYKDEDGGDYLAFSDGTVLHVHYGREGIWRITPTVRGANLLSITQVSADDAENYSDKAFIGAGITWVLRGDIIAMKKPL